MYKKRKLLSHPDWWHPFEANRKFNSLRDQLDKESLLYREFRAYETIACVWASCALLAIAGAVIGLMPLLKALVF